MIRRLLACLLATLCAMPARSATFVADMSTFDDWTDLWQPATPGWTLESGPAIGFHAGFVNGIYMLRFDPAGAVSGDVEVLVKVRYNTVGVGRGGVLIATNDGASGTDFEGYAAQLSNDDVNLVRFDGTGGEADSDFTAFDWTADIDQWMRFQKHAGGIRVRVWEDGDPEPGSWTFSWADTTLTGGYVGLHGRNGGATGTFSYFSVGTGGDPAPSPSTGVAPINTLQNLGAGFGPHKSQQLGGILQ